MTIRVFLGIARAAFLPASVLPFLVGAAYARYTGAVIRPALLLLGLAGVSCAHLGGNLFNDYFDHKSGADELHPRPSVFFGGSRAIQDGVVSPGYVLAAAAAFLSAALLFGSVIILAVPGPVIPMFMLAGGTIAVAYTAPPLKLAYRRLGEAAIFICFGIFLSLGGYAVFAGPLTADVVLVSLPVAFLVLGVIVCNEIPDSPFDSAAGKKNLVGLLGRGNGYVLYGASVALSACSLIFIILRGVVPACSFLVLPLYLAGLKAARLLKTGYDDTGSAVKASGMTVALHGAVGVVMVFILWVANVSG